MGWMVWSFQAHGVPPEALLTSAAVRVQELEGSIRFLPADPAPGAGMVFLPGGMVQPEAYAPMARALAERGHPVAILKVPLRIAPTESMEEEVRSRGRAAQVSVPGIPWVLAGHSRGAAIATRLLARSPENYRALALVGTTHPKVDLSDLSIPVLKIGGTRDCVADRETSEANAHNLPARTEWSWIPGANHAQFGHYGSQLGDCRAEIGRDTQQRALVDLIGDFLSRTR